MTSNAACTTFVNNLDVEGSIITDTLSATTIHAVSSFVEYIDIKQYELSGFDVTGNVSVSGNIDVTENITLSGNLNIDGLVDGRDIAADGIAIDNLESDVTFLSGEIDNIDLQQVTDVGNTTTNSIQVASLTANGKIIGGINNTANGDNAAVVGGTGNIASGNMAFVGSGNGNTASNCAFVGGGDRNEASSPFAFVGGGQFNNAYGFRSAVAGGYCNEARGAYSFVGSGKFNKACSRSAVVDGFCNTAFGSHSFVGGGRYNAACGSYSSVVGGCCNTASGNCSSVVGGRCNTACSYYSFVGGGINNTACAVQSGILGGRDNTASGNFSSVVGGSNNTASSHYSFVGGGRCNAASGNCSFVGGGWCNAASNSYSSVVGGYCNTACAVQSGILGGSLNTVLSAHTCSFIIGSNLTSNAACTTFVNNLSSQGNIYANNVGIGTDSPSSKLDVIGDITATSINQKDTDFIPIAAGTIDSSGTALKIKGATAARTSTGLYTITFDSPQTDANYVITATILDDGSRNDKLYYINKTVTSFQIETASDDNSTTPDDLADNGFDFVVHNW